MPIIRYRFADLFRDLLKAPLVLPVSKMASLATWDRTTRRNSWDNRSSPLPVEHHRCCRKTSLDCSLHVVVLMYKMRMKTGPVLRPFRSHTRFRPPMMPPPFCSHCCRSVYSRKIPTTLSTASNKKHNIISNIRLRFSPFPATNLRFLRSRRKPLYNETSCSNPLSQS